MENPVVNTRHPFCKMHGLGNDFVIFDGRETLPALTPAQVRILADRRWGIGCDQLLVIEPSDKADIFMRIYNADGSESFACGDGARCVAGLIMDDREADAASIETGAGILTCRRAAGGIAVNMGQPSFDWQKIPLSEERDTSNLGLEFGALKDPVALSVGNPHVVFFVDDCDAVDLASLGPKIEHYLLFPERINVGVAQVLDRKTLKLRVWERGAGLTLACGTGATAACAAGVKRGLLDNKADIHLPGGVLTIEWLEDGDIVMTGAVATSFEGEVDILALGGPETGPGGSVSPESPA
jgi:diaminopimelate epimerase